jgi:hypothetical protein
MPLAQSKINRNVQAQDPVLRGVESTFQHVHSSAATHSKMILGSAGKGRVEKGWRPGRVVHRFPPSRIKITHPNHPRANVVTSPVAHHRRHTTARPQNARRATESERTARRPPRARDALQSAGVAETVCENKNQARQNRVRMRKERKR